MKETMGLVFFGDIWGFNALVQKNGKTALEQTKILTTEINKECFQRHEKNFIKSYFLSDSMFYALKLEENNKDKNSENIDTFIRIVNNTVKIAIENNIPLRGAVAYGTLHAEANQLVGTAINSAVSLEKEIGYPLCIIESRTIANLCKDNYIYSDYINKLQTIEIVSLNKLFNAHVFFHDEEYFHKMKLFYEELLKYRVNEGKHEVALVLRNTIISLNKIITKK